MSASGVNQQCLPLGHLGLEVNQGTVRIDDERLGLFREQSRGSFARDGHWNAQKDAMASTTVSVRVRTGRPTIHKPTLEQYEPGGKALAEQVVTKGNGLRPRDAEANLFDQEQTI